MFEKKGSEDKLVVCEVVVSEVGEYEETQEGLYNDYIYVYSQRESCTALEWSSCEKTAEGANSAPLSKGAKQGSLMKGALG
jgi:predicted PolB exonuclease-like 3'-5' exonuclease